MFETAWIPLCVWVLGGGEGVMVEALSSKDFKAIVIVLMFCASPILSLSVLRAWPVSF